MPAIGILGGMGPQASARLHTLIIQQVPNHIAVQSDTDFPEIVHISAPVPNFIHDTTHLETTKQQLIARTNLLEVAGCTVNGIACNTAHLLLPELQASTHVPFVSLPHLVADHVANTTHTRVGLLATPNTLASTLYDDAFGSDVSLIRPDAEMAALLEPMILRQITGSNTEEDKSTLHAIVSKFVATKQLDSVILGCTELPLIFDDEKDEKVIDTLRVLADGLLTAFFHS